MSRSFLSGLFAATAIAGGLYLTAFPEQGLAADDVNCWEQAGQMHAMMEEFCQGEANCRFQCSQDLTAVASMQCECA